MLEERDEFLAPSHDLPIPTERKRFKGLRYFPPNEKYFRGDTVKNPFVMRDSIINPKALESELILMAHSFVR